MLFLSPICPASLCSLSSRLVGCQGHVRALLRDQSSHCLPLPAVLCSRSPSSTSPCRLRNSAALVKGKGCQRKKEKKHIKTEEAGSQKRRAWGGEHAISARRLPNAHEPESSQDKRCDAICIRVSYEYIIVRSTEERFGICGRTHARASASHRTTTYCILRYIHSKIVSYVRKRSECECCPSALTSKIRLLFPRR